MAILVNPTSSDPIGAIFGERLCKLRSRLRDLNGGYEEFIRHYAAHREAVRINHKIKAKQLQGPGIRQIDGPIAGAAEAAGWLMCTIAEEDDDIVFSSRDDFKVKMRRSHTTDLKADY